MSGSDNFDVAVVGGGLAGATAARDLVDEGYRVVLLEARERLGGRAYSAPFGDTGVAVEWGGAYVSSLNRFIKREISRYGLGMETPPVAKSYMHLLGGRRLESPVPIASDEVVEFERMAFDMLQRAARLDPHLPMHEQVYPDFNISWQQYMDSQDPAPGVRDLFEAWAEDLSARPSADFSAMLLFWFAAQLGNSLAAFELALEGTIRGGATALIDEMVKDAGFEVRLGTPVSSIEQSSDEVQLSTADSETVTARAVVVAVPVNCWNSIEFAPALADAKTRACELRPGARGLKGLALVEEAPPGLSGHGSRDAGRGVVLVTSAGEVEGAQLLNIFTPLGYEPGCTDEFDVNDHDQVRQALEAYAPGCRLLDCAGHDWNRDPYSNGSYSSYPIELFECLPDIRETEGRVAFASADIAEGFTMWMDGAVESGSRGAVEAARVLEDASSQPSQAGEATAAP